MTKEMVKFKYRYESTISFQFAMQQLMSFGFTAFAAEEYIWS